MPLWLTVLNQMRVQTAMKMLKPHTRSLLLAGLCLLTAPGLCLAQTQEEPPAFDGDGLPEPPRQREPWTMPRTKLPESALTHKSILTQKSAR